jgi:tetratricopeptide (TPR) repeat protein
MVKQPRLAAIIAALILFAVRPDARAIDAAQDSPAIKEVNAAFTAAQNLDHEEALAHARQAVALEPNNPRTHRGLASIIWINLLFQRGAMTVDHYLGSISTNPIALPKPDPQLAAEFKGALARSIELAEKRLRQNPTDPGALFDAGAAYGVQAAYVATVEGSITQAFRYARRAFETQSAVLARDPSMAAAGMIVGTYRYLIASQPAYVRMFAFLAGFSGDKEKGIALLEVASHDPLSRVDAKTALVLIYSREGRHNEALRLTRELQVEVPRNRLLILEEGSAAIRAGHAGEAEAALTRGLARFDEDKRQKIPGEHALWLYKRGLARLNLNHPADATSDLKRALTVNPLPWVEGRIHVALGKLADLAGRRSEATAEYAKALTACNVGPDRVCQAEARTFLKQPFAFER